MYRALGFDLDNTLYDQAQHVRSFFGEAGSWLHERSSIAAAVAEQSFVRAWERRTMAYPFLFDEALRDLGLWRADWVQTLIAKYRSHRCPLQLYEGVRPLLERLSARYPLFLITDGNGGLQRYKVEELGLHEFFGCILYTGDYGRAWEKPAVHTFSLAALLLDLPAASCVFIGDDPDRDIEGARRAGMATVRVLSGPYRDRPCPLRPDQVLNHVSELESVLEKSSFSMRISRRKRWTTFVSCT